MPMHGDIHMTADAKRPEMSAWEKKENRDAYLYGLLPAMAIFLALLYGGYAAGEENDRRTALAKKERTVAAMQSTAAGCPATAARIREIGADGVYSDREIEIVNALVLSEQGRPGGLRTCEAPSWHRSGGDWIPSQDYAK